MSAIRPTVVAPADSPDQATGYWRAVLTAAAYNGTLGQLQSLYSLVGAFSTVQINYRNPLPASVYVSDFGADGAIVQIIGTQTPQQLLFQVVGAVLGHVPGWAGTVGLPWAVSAILVRPDLDVRLTLINPPRVVYVGDSMGGAIAALLGTTPRPWPTGGIWTQGQPRVGDDTWALAVSVPYERWTNYGDPVPLLPPSVNPLVDQTLLPFWPAVVPQWRHAGTRWRIEIDGTLTQLHEGNSWVDGTEYLIANTIGGAGWTAAHSSLAYACAIRRAIPVPWKTADPAWPLLDAVDDVYSTLLPAPDHVCPDPLHTQEATINQSGPRWAVQGVCG